MSPAGLASMPSAGQTPTMRAASETCAVPSTVAVNLVMGRSTERSGWDMAAVWTTRPASWRRSVSTNLGRS